MLDSRLTYSAALGERCHTTLCVFLGDVRLPSTPTHMLYLIWLCAVQIFCEECSAKTCAIPQFGMNTPVRVCDECFITIKRTNFDFNI